MVDDGKLTKAQYQRMTRAVTTRVVVPDAVMAEIARDSAVLDAIAAKATRTDQTTGLRMAKVK
jgi:hypothetical protein